MSKQQLYGIKFPFTKKDENNFFVDVNSSMKDKVKSQIAHLLFTVKGERLRDPEFGTNLINYIFSENTSDNLDEIKTEINEEVEKWIPNATINDVYTVQDSNNEVYVKVSYTVNFNSQTYDDELITKI